MAQTAQGTPPPGKIQGRNRLNRPLRTTEYTARKSDFQYFQRVGRFAIPTKSPH